jgi:hypothetical protein
MIEKILQAIFEDGRKFRDLGSTSHIPDAPHIDDEHIRVLDNALTEHLTVPQADWEDFSRYPSTVWDHLKRDAFAAGVQDEENYNQAQDFFGQQGGESFDADVEYIRGFLNKPVVLQPVHLGTGEQGIERRLALQSLAGQAGCWWGGQPSIGRWLVELADQEIEEDNGVRPLGRGLVLVPGGEDHR